MLKYLSYQFASSVHHHQLSNYFGEKARTRALKRDPPVIRSNEHFNDWTAAEEWEEVIYYLLYCEVDDKVTVSENFFLSH